MIDIGFIGLGKLGLDCAEVFAEHYKVRGYDIYPRTSDLVEVCDIAETVKHSDWIFIAVPTPHESGYDGALPCSHLPPKDFGHDAVIDALTQINLHANGPKHVVLISTVLPGTTRRHFDSVLDKQHTFLYNPYLIAMGSVKWDMVNPEMVMVGSRRGDDPAMKNLVDLYRPLMKNNPRYITGTWEECESIKIFYNTFVSAKIGLANMIQDFATRIGNINVDVVTDALAQSTMRIMGPKYMTAGMGDAGACHPRDNIALRWLAQEYDIGYDIFDTIMHAREIQARNLAEFLVKQSESYYIGESAPLPIAIHGKAYKPDVPYCIGSYSTLVGHYVKELGHPVVYIDPLADDQTDVVKDLGDTAHVVLWAHSRQVTYDYTGATAETLPYCQIPQGSVIVDPWRKMASTGKHTIIHYGNTREQ